MTKNNENKYDKSAFSYDKPKINYSSSSTIPSAKDNLKTNQARAMKADNFSAKKEDNNSQNATQRQYKLADNSKFKKSFKISEVKNADFTKKTNSKNIKNYDFINEKDLKKMANKANEFTKKGGAYAKSAKKGIEDGDISEFAGKTAKYTFMATAGTVKTAGNIGDKAKNIAMPKVMEISKDQKGKQLLKEWSVKKDHYNFLLDNKKISVKQYEFMMDKLSAKTGKNIKTLGRGFKQYEFLSKANQQLKPFGTAVVGGVTGATKKVGAYGQALIDTSENGGNIGDNVGAKAQKLGMMMAKDTATIAGKATLYGTKKAAKATASVTGLSKLMKKKFFLRRNVKNGKLMTKADEKAAVTAARVARMMVEVAARTVVAVASVGGGVAAVCVVVFIIAIAVLNSGGSILTPFAIKPTIKDDGTVIFEDVDYAERIEEFYKILDGVVDLSNDQIDEYITNIDVTAKDDLFKSGITPDDQNEYELKMREYERQMRDFKHGKQYSLRLDEYRANYYELYSGYPSKNVIVDENSGWVIIYEFEPIKPTPPVPTITSTNCGCGARTVTFYDGARWSTSEDEEGVTEATKVPHGKLYDEMLCSTSTFFMKRFMEGKNSEFIEGKYEYIDGFHVMDEDDVGLYYNMLPLWELTIRPDATTCGGCVLHVHGENSYYSCPGHITDVGNLKLYFEHKTRDIDGFNVYYGGLNCEGTDCEKAIKPNVACENTVWGKWLFNGQDKSIYDNIKPQYDVWKSGGTTESDEEID